MEDVPAILLPWYPGMENGNAVAGALAGDTNPGGKLPLSWPGKIDDNPAAQSRQMESKHDVVRHDEGIFMGYRWYDQYKIAPQFPFGYGLSYTTFSLGMKDVPKEFRLGQGLSVQVEVRNTGQRAGSEVFQLYVHQNQCAVPRPPQELKAFQRVELQPGEARKVTLERDDSSFAYWHPERHAWTVDPGAFELRVGSSSRDIAGTETIQMLE